MGERAAALSAQVMARCDALARCSELPEELTRTFLCEAMKETHAAVRGWMQAAGMQVRVDAAGNLVGRLPC